MPNKRKSTNRNLINALLDSVSLAHVEWCTDFERAVFIVISENFNNIGKGCFFHFTQCIYRKVIDLGLKQPYEEKNWDFAHSNRQMVALAFILEDDVAGSLTEVI